MWNDRKSEGQNWDSPLKAGNTDTAVFSPYEVKTLSLVSPLKVYTEPSVSCASSPLYIVVAVSNQVSIFKEDSFELIWELQTDNPVCISLSDDSCLLLVAENSGLFCLYHIPTKTLIWRYICQRESSPVSLVETYLSVDSSGFLKIHVVTKEQFIFEFSNISVSTLYNAINDDNFSEVFAAVHIEEMDLLTLYPHCQVTNFFQMFRSIQSIALAVKQCASKISSLDFFTVEGLIAGDMEADWEWNPTNKLTFQCYDISSHGLITKIASTRDGKYIVFLNENHAISIMCPFTHLVLKTWGEKGSKGCITNFVINETVDPSSFLVVERKIGLLIASTTEKSGSTSHIFEIRKFPSFQLIHSVCLSQFVQLVECKPNQDFWYIVDGELLGDSGEKSVQSLNVKAIFESLPEARLINLVNRRKFSEAEKLAKISNLSLEVIHKTKINCILKNLSVNKYENASKADLDLVWNELEDSFKNIKEEEFIRSCILYSLPEKNLMERLLLCIKNWVIFNSSSDAKGSKDIISQVNLSLNKLKTYEILSTNLDSCVPLKDFLKKDLLDYMLSEMKIGNLNSAFIIWQRHKDELFTSLGSETVLQIISSIPDFLPSQHLIPFLCDEFLPCVFSRNPDSIDMVADWLIQRVYLIELSEMDLWPENGMKLVTAFLQVIQDLHKKDKRGEISFSTSFCFAGIHKKAVNTTIPVGCLSEFSKDLAWLVSLKSQFNCKVSLADCQDSRQGVIFAALDRVDLKLLCKVIDKFARPFALENNLDLESCLEHYIKQTLQSSCFTWWSWDEEPWEERLIAVTENITSTNRWVNASLLIASRAAVPWSQRMQNLVRKGIDCDHPRKPDFQIQSKLVGLKEVLLKYDMKSFPINNDAQLVNVLVSYILKQNKESALEDAKKVLMSVYDHALNLDVIYKCLPFGLSHNKLDETLELFSKLPEDVAVKCAGRLLKYIKLQLDNKVSIKHQKDLIKNLLYSGIYILEFLQRVKKPGDEDLLTPFRSLLKLQEEFGIYILFSEISSRSQCRILIESAISDFLRNKTLCQTANTSVRKHVPLSSSISRLYRLGDILLFEREEVMSFLITDCLLEQKYDLVLKLCKELMVSYPTRNTSETLMQVVEHFYLNFRSIEDINFSVMVDTICHLNSVAVNYCNEDAIVDSLPAVQLSNFLSCLKEVSGQHSFQLKPEFTTDSYHKWKFYPIYQDEGFQLDCDLVTNFVMNISKAILPQSDLLKKDTIVEQDYLLKCAVPLVDHMNERGQGMVALRTLFQFYHLDIQSKKFASDILQTFSKIQAEVEKTTYSIAQRALSQRKVDFYFTYNLLTVLHEDSRLVSLKALLKWCSNDLNRLTVVGRIGMELANSLQNTDAFLLFENIHKKASLLSRQNIKSLPLKVILNTSSPESNWAVVKELISQNVGLPILYECCSAFQIKTDNALIAYLNNILTESEKNFLNSENFEDKIVPSLKQAEFVISCIADEELVYNNFLSIINEVSPYSYEILLFIEEQLHIISANIRTINSGSCEKEIKLLKFLQVYKRISPLDELEHSKWRCLQPSVTKPPAISSERLPFHSFLQENPHKITNPELTANTLPVWLKIAPVLRIPADHLVIIAVKNNVVNYLTQHSYAYVVLNPDMRFISVINDMIEKVSEPEPAVCCASWVANKMPPGGNKVSFAAMAVKFVQQWHRQNPACENVIEVYNRLKSLSRQSAIERVLYKSNLTTDEILSLTSSPTRLIEHLMEDFSLNIDKCMKVSEAVLEIGSIIESDMTKIFMNFILKWANITQSAANLDETFLEDLPLSKEFEDDVDGKNILRMINLLLSLPESIVPNIYNILRTHYSDMPTVQRNRLLLCFVSVFDIQTVAKIFGWDEKVLEDYLIPMICSFELENLNLLYSVPMFVKCNKTELIQRILSSNFNNPKAVIFCVRLCLEYNIWDDFIWEVILRRMVIKYMEYSLQDILQSTQGYLKHLWHTEAFIAAWKCVMRQILQMKHNDAAVFLSKLYNAVLRCPCVSSLDVDFLKNELKYVMQTFGDRNTQGFDSALDISAFVLNLKKLVDNYSLGSEN